MTRWQLLLFAATALSCGGRGHVLEDGTFGFTLSEVLRDDCGLSADPHVMSTGELKTTGNIVALDYGFLDIKLKGIYLSSQERMTFDGTAVNTSTEVRGAACLLDAVAIHLDANTLDATHFTGAMSIAFDARQKDQCVCQMWVKYVATKQ